jgi:diguanylate cyclase (GGDEF)-like protein
MTALSDNDLIWVEKGEISAMGFHRRDVWLLQLEKDGFPWLQERDENIQSFALLRLGSKEKPFGVIGLGSDDQDRFHPSQSTDFLAHLAQVLSLSLEHAISHQRLARLAITDALTGTQNRRFLQPYSHQPLSSWFGKGVPVASLFFDMDDFKGINDRLGHAAGDEALQAVADIIRKHVRAQDPLIRMGGDEFVLLLPSCQEEKAMVIAQNVHQDMQNFVCKDEPVSMSIGLAYSDKDEDLTLTQLIKKADKAMYVAKALGGNRIEAAPEKAAE